MRLTKWLAFTAFVATLILGFTITAKARNVDVHNLMIGQTTEVKTHFSSQAYTCVPKPEKITDVEKLQFLNAKMGIITLFPTEVRTLKAWSESYIRCGAEPNTQVEVKIWCWFKNSNDYFASYAEHKEVFPFTEFHLEGRTMKLRDAKIAEMEAKYCTARNHQLDSIEIDQSQPHATSTVLKQSF